MARDPDLTLVGRTIAGKFAIESVIGGGAMGAVFRARQVALEKSVAIKVMHRELSRDPTYVARFLREAKAASRIDHPASVRVIDFGEEPDGLLYLAMELLEGRDLYTLLREDGPLPPARVGSIVLQVLAAVAVAHEMGVVHRDIKPENIMIQAGTDDEGQPRDVVKVCDFGIAKITGGRGGKVEPVTGPAITVEGLVVGTPEYMSPEQGRGEPLDARSDLYSVGVILYQMLAGRVPFEAESALGIVLKHVTEPPTPPTHVRADVDPRLEAVCLNALEKKRELRYQSARAMRADLRAALEGKDVLGPGKGSVTAMEALALEAGRSEKPALPTPVVPVVKRDDGPAATADTAVAFDSSALRALQQNPTPSSEPPPALSPAALPRTRWGGIVLGGALLLAAVGVVAMKLPTLSSQPPGSSTAPPASAPLVTAPPATETLRVVPPLVEAPPTKATVPDRPNQKAPKGSASATSAAAAASLAQAASNMAMPDLRLDGGAAVGVPKADKADGSPAPQASAPVPPTAGGRFDPKLAKVTVSGVRAIGVSPEALRKEVPDAKILKCWRAALTGAGPKPPPSTMTLHIDATEEGKVQGATLKGAPPIPDKAGECVLRTMIGKQVTSEGSPLVSGDVDLVFSAD